jgi:hypothetical protein
MTGGQSVDGGYGSGVAVAVDVAVALGTDVSVPVGVDVTGVTGVLVGSAGLWNRTRRVSESQVD